jgi:hypothetical protein
MNAKEPNWEKAASEILSALIPLLLNARRDSGVSLSELGGFRDRVVEILRRESKNGMHESA